MQCNARKMSRNYKLTTTKMLTILHMRINVQINFYGVRMRNASGVTVINVQCGI